MIDFLILFHGNLFTNVKIFETLAHPFNLGYLLAMQYRNIGHTSFSKFSNLAEDDSIFPYLFLLFAEFLTYKINSNRNKQGIVIDDTNYLISQRDCTKLLDGSENRSKPLLMR